MNALSWSKDILVFLIRQVTGSGQDHAAIFQITFYLPAIVLQRCKRLIFSKWKRSERFRTARPNRKGSKVGSLAGGGPLIRVGRVVRVFVIKFSFDLSKNIRIKAKSDHQRSGSLNPKECTLVVASEVSVQT